MMNRRFSSSRIPQMMSGQSWVSIYPVSKGGVMLEVNDFNAIHISLASPEQVRGWSSGEVTKPETINYRTLKPEQDGLFSERIFGPTKDWECSCGKYKGVRFKGIVCDRCGVVVARSRVRRERMGHIELASPVSDIWYVDGVPSRMSLLLGLSPRKLESILYFALDVVTGIDEDARQRELMRLDEELANLEQGLDGQASERQRLEQLRRDLEGLRKMDLLQESRFRDLSDAFGSVFRAGMGAEAVRELLAGLDLDALAADLRRQISSTASQRRKKATRRLKVVEAFRRSGTSPTWMILTVLPVLPPDLRPLVQLDGGRFASSDLNDLYRRVINRNNRLKRLLELGAPEIIIRNEKRMLQEACDALIDNGRRGRAIAGTGNHRLKSLSDMLKGKQGRFRQNLLGKRVDYSGRSVIVVGPDLKLHQCGLPKRMALELFKPFVMRQLVSQNITQNIKSAKRMVERVRPEVWDVLDQVIKEHPVLLNRAPTLHRLGIQAFMPVLVEGSAIQIHPLVCKAFNADFDGDQMAVHVPLFSGAIAEAKNLMMSSQNILSAADGHPVVAPTQDIVLGTYYLTMIKATPNIKDQELPTYGTAEEALLALDNKRVHVQQEVRVRIDGKLIRTSPGRVLFNTVLPIGVQPGEGHGEAMQYQNAVFDKKALRAIVAECFRLHGNELTARVANDIKRVGFAYATKAGITISAMDIKTPAGKAAILAGAEKKLGDIDLQFKRGLITDDERYTQTVDLWTQATEEVTAATMKSFDALHPVFMMANSGARGNIQQIRQLAGMRGLMADPTGRIIDLPIKANFSEGLTVLEYFISP